MSVRKKIEEDFKVALKNRDSLAKEALRMIKAEIKNREIENGAGYQLSDEEITGVLTSAVKKRKESARLFKEGGRDDLFEKETAEIELLIKYLPAQLSEDDVRKKVSEIIEKTGATDVKQMGLVMKAVMAEVGPSADGKVVSGIVRELLSK